MNLKLLSSGLIVYSLSEGILDITIPLYSLSLGADGMIIGLIVSAYAIAVTVAAPLWGKVSDIFGRKLALSIGMLGCSITIFSFTFVSDPKLFVGISLVQGLVAASFWIVPTALIADLHAPQKMGEALGKIATFQGIGWVVGPLLGGFLIGQFNCPCMFYVCSAFAFCTTLMIFFGLRKKPDVLNKRDKDSSKIQLKFGAIAKKKMAIAFVYTVFAGILFGVIESQFIVHSSEILGKEYLVGFLLTSYFIAEAFIQPPAGRLSDIIGRHRTILLAFITCALGFLILIFPLSFVSLLIAVVVIGGGIGMLYVVSTALLMDVTPSSQRGLASGFDHVFWGIGYSIGPMLGGIVAITSITAPYMMCIATSAIGCTLPLIILVHRPKTT